MESALEMAGEVDLPDTSKSPFEIERIGG